jgi:hypothetical protein
VEARETSESSALNPVPFTPYTLHLEQGDAAFGEHGFGADERNPIYQGDYHEYEGGDWVEM